MNKHYKLLITTDRLTFDDLKMREGKEALQKKILNTINTIVTSVGHKAENAESNDSADEVSEVKNEHIEGPIENIYFTSFIMQ